MTNQTPLPHAVELLPCPFCGGQACLFENCRAVECVMCGAEVYKPTTSEAIAAWNELATPAQAAPEAVRRLSSAELEVSMEDGKRTWANSIGGDECLDVAKAVEAACWVRYAVPSRQLVSVSSIDVERLIAECLPGGSTRDPQHVADAIRRYCDAWPSRWRLLGEADIIQAGDEFLADDAVTWCPVVGDGSLFVSREYRPRHFKAMRRRADPQKAKGPGAHTEASEAGQEPPTHGRMVWKK